jgi:hypothetical protein
MITIVLRFFFFFFLQNLWLLTSFVYAERYPRTGQCPEIEMLTELEA